MSKVVKSVAKKSVPVVKLTLGKNPSAHRRELVAAFNAKPQRPRPKSDREKWEEQKKAKAAMTDSEKEEARQKVIAKLAADSKMAKLGKPVAKSKVSRKQLVKASHAVPKKSAAKKAIPISALMEHPRNKLAGAEKRWHLAQKSAAAVTVAGAHRKAVLAALAAEKLAPKKTVTMQRGAGKPRITVKARLSEPPSRYEGALLKAASFGGVESEAVNRCFEMEPPRPIQPAAPRHVHVLPPVMPVIPLGTLFYFRNPKGSVDLGILREEMPANATSVTLWLGTLPPGSVPEGQSDQVCKTIAMSQVISRAEMKD